MVTVPAPAGAAGRQDWIGGTDLTDAGSTLLVTCRRHSHWTTACNAKFVRMMLGSSQAGIDC